MPSSLIWGDSGAALLPHIPFDGTESMGAYAQRTHTRRCAPISVCKHRQIQRPFCACVGTGPKGVDRGASPGFNQILQLGELGGCLQAVIDENLILVRTPKRHICLFSCYIRLITSRGASREAGGLDTVTTQSSDDLSGQHLY